MGLRPDTITVTDSVASTASAVITVTAGIWQTYQQQRGLPFQKFPNAQVIEADYGSEKDWAFERARQALLVGFPGMGPYDSLDLIAAERQLPRAVAESPSDAGGALDQALAARLAGCWDRPDGWMPAGSFKSLLYALDRAGYPMGTPNGCHVIQRHQRYAWLTASGGAPVYGTHPIWSFDSSADRVWNQFGIVFGADVTGFVAGSVSATILNGLVAKWKPAKARFMGTWVEVTGPWWDWPIGVAWDDAGRVWGGGVSRFIPPV